jgi:hypothetical protein
MHDTSLKIKKGAILYSNIFCTEERTVPMRYPTITSGPDCVNYRN